MHIGERQAEIFSSSGMNAERRQPATREDEFAKKKEKREKKSGMSMTEWKNGMELATDVLGMKQCTSHAIVIVKIDSIEETYFPRLFRASSRKTNSPRLPFVNPEILVRAPIISIVQRIHLFMIPDIRDNPIFASLSLSLSLHFIVRVKHKFYRQRIT